MRRGVARWAPLSLSALGLAIACARSAPPDTRPSAAPAGYRVTVGAAEAEIAFPFPTPARWEWYRPGTPAGGLEYRWTATVQRADTTFEVGLLLWKGRDGAPASGELADMMQRSVLSVARQRPDGSYYIWMNPPARIDVQAGGDSVALRLRDSAWVARVFASRPERATVHVQAPGRPAAAVPVPITYDRR